MSSAKHAYPTRATDNTDDRVVLQALYATPLLRGLDDRVMQRLAAISRIIAVSEDTEIGRPGDTAEYLYIVLDGQLAASSSAANGSSAVVEVIHAGHTIGLATLLARLPQLLHFRSISPCRLLSIEAVDLLALVEQEVTLVAALLRAEARTIRALVRQVCDLKLRTTAQRLGCYLLSLSTEQGGSENVSALRLPFDKRLLAARLGCRQENLSRAFASLRSLGVETHGARVILHDVARLRDYAVPDEPFDEMAA